jgi:deoxyribonuclease-4
MPKIRLGTAGIPICCNGSSADGVRKVKELGRQAMEVEFVRGVGMKNKTAEEVGKAARAAGIELSIHAPYYVNLSSVEKLKVRQSMRRILDSCERGHHMGAKIVVFHPGYYGKLGREETFERVKAACQEMSDKLRQQGWKVLLGPEVTGKTFAFGTEDELLKLSRQVRQCAPVIDFAHLYARNQGRVDFGEVLGKFKRFRHLHTHFSGINFSRTGERNHLPILARKPDYRPIAREILRRKLDITMICESPLIERDALAMKRIFGGLGYRW